jgi:hypothetical protein
MPSACPTHGALLLYVFSFVRPFWVVYDVISSFAPTSFGAPIPKRYVLCRPLFSRGAGYWYYQVVALKHKHSRSARSTR